MVRVSRAGAAIRSFGRERRDKQAAALQPLQKTGPIECVCLDHDPASHWFSGDIKWLDSGALQASCAACSPSRRIKKFLYTPHSMLPLMRWQVPPNILFRVVPQPAMAAVTRASSFSSYAITTLCLRTRNSCGLFVFGWDRGVINDPVSLCRSVRLQVRDDAQRDARSSCMGGHGTLP